VGPKLRMIVDFLGIVQNAVISTHTQFRQDSNQQDSIYSLSGNVVAGETFHESCCEFTTVKEHSIVYCTCREIVKLFRFLKNEKNSGSGLENRD
jgi:hypothetical protein